MNFRTLHQISQLTMLDLMLGIWHGIGISNGVVLCMLCIQLQDIPLLFLVLKIEEGTNPFLVSMTKRYLALIVIRISLNEECVDWNWNWDVRKSQTQGRRPELSC
jgi:hypothetical protein